MSIKYYKIEPDLSNDEVAYIDDWEFEYWPNKPKSEIVKNSDGTFSVIMEKDFVPLVRQLKQLFEDDNVPENGTYLGEAKLTGKNEPLDCIEGNFINSKQGLVISKRFLELLKKYHLPEHFIYELPLIKRKKIYDGYFYVFFKESIAGLDLDVRLIIEKYTPVVCVSESLKEDLINSGIKGCSYTLIKDVL
jgi:hypothetical protein